MKKFVSAFIITPGKPARLIKFDAPWETRLWNKKAPAVSERGLKKKILAVTYPCAGKPALLSAQRRFTSEFGMGSGGASALWPPGKQN